MFLKQIGGRPMYMFVYISRNDDSRNVRRQFYACKETQKMKKLMLVERIRKSECHFFNGTAFSVSQAAPYKLFRE